MTNTAVDNVKLFCSHRIINVIYDIELDLLRYNYHVPTQEFIDNLFSPALKGKLWYAHSMTIICINSTRTFQTQNGPHSQHREPNEAYNDFIEEY